MSTEHLKTTVRERYGKAALQVAAGARTGCCGGGSCGASTEDPITSNLYSEAQTAALPAEAVLASLGCGNPTALAELHEGDVVLDLGSGGGIDVLLSARRVGPAGKAYGLDMTDEMLALARENQRKAGVENVEFLKGDIESIPLPDASVDVIIFGPLPLLDTLTRQDVHVTVDVTGLEAGTHQLTPKVEVLISDVKVESILPGTIEVILTAGGG